MKNLSCLLPEAKDLLLNIVEHCKFIDKYVLVGGSALTLHLCHRKSEDLDFFTFNDDFDAKEIFEYIKQFSAKEILNQTDDQIDLLLDGVKVTFFNAKWEFLKPAKVERFNLASIEAIAAMKINVLFLRAKYRDYYDLYCLAKAKMALREMFEKAKFVIEGITFKLFVTALLYIDDIEDDDIEYLEPVERITKKEIRDYFQNVVNHP